MQRKMSVPPIPGKSPGERFGNALKTVATLPPERASEVRHHVPKKREPTAEKPTPKTTKRSA